MPERPVLVTVPNVELLQAGEWRTSTGTFSWSHDDLAAAVAAQDDPAIRTPVLKLGHTDPRFDGEPAVGRIENLRLSENGMTLIGDLVGVPAWLADIMPSAFPSRSIEGAFDWTTAKGTQHRFVLTGLALLGVQAPAVETLEDIAALYEVTPPDVAASHGTPVRATFTTEEMPMPRNVAAGVNTDDIRREYYAGPGSGWDWWIREIEIDPPQLIVENDASGKLFRVPYTISGADVTFADAVEVAIQYVDKAAASRPAAVFASKAESRPAMSNPNRPSGQGGTSMDPKALRTSLGLAEDATDDEVKAALAEHGFTSETPEPEPEVVETTPPAADPKQGTAQPAEQPKESDSKLPEGVVAIDQAALDQLRADAQQGVAARERQRVDDRNRYLDECVKAGKFPPARREYWQGYYDRDEQGARQWLDSVAAGSAVPVDERGHVTTDDVPADQSAYPGAWFPELARNGQEG